MTPLPTMPMICNSTTHIHFISRNKQANNNKDKVKVGTEIKKKLNQDLHDQSQQ